MEPYVDYNKNNDWFYRRFEKEVDDLELTWHRDERDRSVYVVAGFGWQFQYENKVPFTINEGDTIFINKLDFHRLIKGDTNLILKIQEF